jgi:hypothetical protein
MKNNNKLPGYLSGIQVKNDRPLRTANMNEKVLLIAKILLLCAGCVTVAAAVIYVLSEWLEW